MKPASSIFRTTVLLTLAAAGWAQQPFVPTVTNTPGSPSQVLYGAYNGFLIRSNDLGMTWVPIYVTQAGLPQPPIQGFAIDATDPTGNTLYLATTIAAGAFWKSTDGGATWAAANTGLPTTGAGVDYFKYLVDTTSYLYIKAGGKLFRSADQGATWGVQGNLPGSAGSIAIAESRRQWIYYVEPSTLAVFFSGSEGLGWEETGFIPASLQNTFIQGMGILYFNPDAFFIDVEGQGSGQGPYVSYDGGVTFTDATSGLGDFTQILSYSNGPTYAITPGYVGTYRSTDQNVLTWQLLGATGNHDGVTAVDPNMRTTVYGVQTGFGSAAQTALVTSTNADTAMNWTTISATITPTLAKPAAAFNVTLEQGAPYSVAFTVQTAENSTWQIPVTVATSGESWIQVGAASGTTPLTNSITINTAGLAPGSYTSTLLIKASASNNKSVSVPVMLTIRALGSVGPAYLVSTVVGNGQSSVTATSGMAANLGIGAAKALAFDASGNVLLSSGNYLWQLKSGTLTALAGNGVNASNGDGSNPLSASIANPDAMALDSQGSIYFTEYAPEQVRKLSSSGINAYLDMTKPPNYQAVGSHSLLLDSTNRLLLTGPGGLLRFDGAQLKILAPYAFSDPYGTVADASGNVYVSDRALHQIVEITPAGVVSVVAGTGFAGFSGDGGPAAQAALNTPEGMAVDPQGNLYIADSGNQRIRTITADGNIHTIAGSGVSGFAGDGKTADFAAFVNPSAVLVDGQGNVYVADSGNNRVRLLVAQGTATPTVSPGSLSFTESQGGSAAAAGLPAETLSFSGTGGAAFTASIPSIMGGNWLLIAPGNGGIQVSVLPNSLPQGAYTAQILVTFQGAAASITVPVVLNVTPPQTVSISATSLGFTSQAGGPQPPAQQIAVSSTNGSVAFSVGTTSSGWLSVGSTSGSTPTNLTVSVNTQNLSAGTYTGSIGLSVPGVLANPILISVTLAVTAAPPPPQPLYIYNAASGMAGVVAPGEIITITGSQLGPASPASGISFQVDANGAVAPTLGGVQVLFDNNPGTPTFVSAGQINVVVPYEIAGRTSTNVVVSNGGVPSASIPETVATVVPGLFTDNLSGAGQVAALNQNGTINGPQGNGFTPAPPGSEIQIYGTGGGQTSPPSVTGTITPNPINAGYLNVPGTVTATVGGMTANVDFAGAAPGLITGAVQFNVHIPTGISGNNVPIVISINGVSTPLGTTIAVQ